MHLAHSPDRRWFALAIGASTLRLWRLSVPAHELSGAPLEQPFALEMNTGGHGIAGMIFADASHLIVAHHDGVVQCWSLRAQGSKEPSEPLLEEAEPSAEALLGQRELGDYRSVPIGTEDRQGREVIASLTWLIRLDASVEAFMPRRMAQPREGVRAVIGAADGGVMLLDAALGRKPVVRWLGQHRASVVRAALSRDGSHVATASRDRRLAIWRPDDALVSDAEGGAWRVFEESGGEIWALSFSSTGRYLVSGGIDNNIYTWDTRAERALRAVGRAHDGWIAGLDWSEDDKLIAAASWDKTVGLFRAGSLQPLYCFEYHQDYVSHAMFVPGTTLLVSTGYDRSVAMWDWRQAKLMASFQEHDDWIQALEWLGDGVFMTASNDLTVRLWSATEMAPLAVLGEEKVENPWSSGVFETSNMLGGLGSFESVANGRFDVSRRVMGRGDSVPTEEIFEDLEALTQQEFSLGEEVSVFIEERELAIPAFLQKRSLVQEPSELQDDLHEPEVSESVVEETPRASAASVDNVLEKLRASGMLQDGIESPGSTLLELPSGRFHEEEVQVLAAEERLEPQEPLEDVEDVSPQSLAFMEEESPENTGESSWAELARSVTLTGEGPVLTAEDMQSMRSEMEAESSPEVVLVAVHEVVPGGVHDGVLEGVHDGVSEGVHDGMSEGVHEDVSGGVHEDVSEGGHEGVSEGPLESTPEEEGASEQVDAALSTRDEEVVSLSSLRAKLSVFKRRSEAKSEPTPTPDLAPEVPEEGDPKEAPNALMPPEVTSPAEPPSPEEAPSEDARPLLEDVSAPALDPVPSSPPQDVEAEDTQQGDESPASEALATDLVEPSEDPEEPPAADQATTMVQRARPALHDSTAEYHVPPEIAQKVLGDSSPLGDAPVAFEPPPSEQVTRKADIVQASDSWSDPEPIASSPTRSEASEASEASATSEVSSQTQESPRDDAPSPNTMASTVTPEAPLDPSDPPLARRRLTLRDLAKSKRLREKLDALPAQADPEIEDGVPPEGFPEIHTNIFGSESSISGFSDSEEDGAPEVLSRDGTISSPEASPAAHDSEPDPTPDMDPDATQPPRAFFEEPPSPTMFQHREQTPVSGPPTSMSYHGDETVPPVSAAFQEANESGDVTQLPLAATSTSSEEFSDRRRTANWNTLDDSESALSEVLPPEEEEPSDGGSVNPNMLASPLIELDEHFFETSFVESDPYPGEGAPDVPTPNSVEPSDPVPRKNRFMRVDRLLDEASSEVSAAAVDRKEIKALIRKKISALRESEPSEDPIGLKPTEASSPKMETPHESPPAPSEEPGGLLRQTQEQVVPTLSNGLRESTAEHSNPQELFEGARAARQPSNPFVEDAANRSVSATVTRSEVDRALARRTQDADEALSPHPFSQTHMERDQLVTSTPYSPSPAIPSPTPAPAPVQQFSRMEATAPVAQSALDEALDAEPHPDNLSSTFFGMSGLVLRDDTPAEFLEGRSDRSLEFPHLYDLTIPEMWHMRVGERKAAMKIFRRRATRAGLYRNQAQFETKAPQITSLHFQPDLKFVASCGLMSHVEVWSSESGERVFFLPTSASKLQCVTSTPDGRVLIAGDDAAHLHLWLLPRDINAPSASVGRAVLEGHTSPITTIDVDSTGKFLLSGSVDGNVKLWEMETGSCVATMAAHQGPVTSVAFSAKGPLTVGMDGALKMWDKRGQLINALDSFGSLTSVSYRKGATYLADTEGRVYRYHRGKTSLLFSHQGAVHALEMTGDDVGASVGVDGKVCLFHWGDSEPFQTLDLGTPAHAVSLTGDVLCVGTQEGHIEYYIRRDS